MESPDWVSSFVVAVAEEWYADDGIFIIHIISDCAGMNGGEMGEHFAHCLKYKMYGCSVFANPSRISIQLFSCHGSASNLHANAMCVLQSSAISFLAFYALQVFGLDLHGLLSIGVFSGVLHTKTTRKHICY